LRSRTNRHSDRSASRSDGRRRATLHAVTPFSRPTSQRS
jgi:hypothetical protein